MPLTPDRWPNKISTTELYNTTPQTPWSKTITKRRVKLYGHLMTLPEDTPVRKAMVEYDKPLKMARGAPKFTWNKALKMITLNLVQIRRLLQRLLRTGSGGEPWSTR